MARCNCSGSTCSCIVIAGEGMTVTGSGQPSNPYLLSNVGIAGALKVQDSPTVDLTLNGGGVQSDPYLLSAVARVRLLADMIDMAPGETADPGDTVVVQANGTFKLLPPPVAPAGAVNVGAGIIGNGSVSTPIAAATSGTWGSPPLDAFGSDSTIGQAIYVDSAGKLRASPLTVTTVTWASITGKPTTFDSTWAQVTGKPTSFPAVWGDVSGKPNTYDTTWAQVANKPATSTLDGRTIYVSTAAPTAAQGADGDLWFRYV